MYNFQVNSADTYEHIEVDLTRFPIAYGTLIEEHMDLDPECTYEEAHMVFREAAMKTELELYYHKGCGLFAVDPEAVSCGVVPFCPYCREQMEGIEED